METGAHAGVCPAEYDTAFFLVCPSATLLHNSILLSVSLWPLCSSTRLNSVYSCTVERETDRAQSEEVARSVPATTRLFRSGVAIAHALVSN